MFMLSSVRVQMMTLCSELVSRAVYREAAQSPRRLWKDVLEGNEGECFTRPLRFLTPRDGHDNVRGR